jgi:hypothetical protein
LFAGTSFVFGKSKPHTKQACNEEFKKNDVLQRKKARPRPCFLGFAYRTFMRQRQILNLFGGQQSIKTRQKALPPKTQTAMSAYSAS